MPVFYYHNTMPGPACVSNKRKKVGEDLRLFQTLRP
jgi:hypothetical protein